MSGLGRKKRRPSFSVQVNARTEVVTYDYRLAEQIAVAAFSNEKNVLIKSGATRKTVARYIYGHKQ